MFMGARSGRAAVVAALFLCIFGIRSAQAQHFWIDPRAEARLSLTDNADLVTRGDLDQGASKEFGTVLNVAAGLNTRLEGARTRLAFDYAFDYYYFLNDGGTDKRHHMFGQFDSEVWEDHLTLNARASWREQYLNQRGSLSNNFANRTNNRRLIQNYTATAILKGGIRDFADWRTTYRFGISMSPADNLEDDTLTANFSDTTSHEITMSLGSGERFNHFEWRLFADSSRVTRSLDVNDFRYEHVGGQLTYKMNRFLSVFGTFGYSRNDFQSETLSEEGLGWTGGLRWTPGRKLDLRVEHGREGNRKVWSGSVQYFFFKRLDFLGTYTDTITANSIVSNDTLQSYQFNEDIGIVDGQGLPVDESDPRFTFSDIDFRRQAAQGTFTWRHKRSQVYVTGNMEWRTFDNDSGTSRSMGVSGGFEHELTRSSTLSGSIGGRRSRFEGGDRVDTYYTANLDWTKTLSRYFKAAIGYAHSERHSTDATQNLAENSLTFYLRGTF